MALEYLILMLRDINIFGAGAFVFGEVICLISSLAIARVMPGYSNIEKFNLCMMMMNMSMAFIVFLGQMEMLYFVLIAVVFTIVVFFNTVRSIKSILGREKA